MSQDTPVWREENKKLTWEKEAVAELSVVWLEQIPGRRGRRIERYYRHMAQCWRRRWEGPFYRQACMAMKEAGEGDFIPWRAALTGTITRNENGILSVRMEAREWRGTGETVCGSWDTWDVEQGIPIELHQLAGGRRGLRRQLLAQVLQQGERRVRQGERTMFRPIEPALRSHFSIKRFNLTETGAEIFYPQGTVADEEAGLICFPVVLPSPAKGKDCGA